MIEIISPAGFERYFEELADVFGSASGPPDQEAIGAVADRYGLTFDFTWVPELVDKYGLTPRA
jgi:predicted 3-demethylubiquinone-9 3-methyltransferase (glyoxalase superfamily)